MTWFRWPRALRTAPIAAALLLGAVGVESAWGAWAPLVQRDESWQDQVWDAARNGRFDALIALLDRAPQGGDDRSAALHESVALLKANLEKRESDRLEQVAKVEETLAKHLAEEQSEEAISSALVAAVELYMLATDKAAFMGEPRITSLVAGAERAARAAEDRGDWLRSNELFYRLNVLLEEQGTYRPDVIRQNQRLAMIRLYAPEKLWELRNRAIVADGGKPLPPYNPVGDKFVEKLSGIDKSMVTKAITTSAERHIDRSQVGLNALMASGLDAIETMANTADLADAFPNLRSEAARARLQQYLDEQRTRLGAPGRSTGSIELNRLINGLLEVNRESTRIPDEALLHEFGNGAMGALDEYSAIIWPDEIRRFERNTQGRFIGIGVQIQLDELSNIKVVTPLEGTPAQRGGIQAEDIIKKVDGASTAGFSLDQAVDVITGKANTKVTITVERKDAEGSLVEKDIELKRATIELRSVKGWRRLGTSEEKWDWFVDPNNKIGYVRLSGFAETTTIEFDRAIAEMKRQGAEGLILDLRFNPGGLLDQAVMIANRFIGGGNVIVSTLDAEGAPPRTQEKARNIAATLGGMPVVVLVNEGAASASEIVSGALRHYGDEGEIRSLLVGQRTFGKGSVQNVWPLTGDAALKLTTQFYALPDGSVIHRKVGAPLWGVEPNITVEMLPDQITAAYSLRQNADVLKLDADGNIIAEETPTDPDDLINKGLDLQLQTAMVVLQSQLLPRADRAMLDR